MNFLPSKPVADKISGAFTAKFDSALVLALIFDLASNSMISSSNIMDGKYAALMSTKCELEGK